MPLLIVQAASVQNHHEWKFTENEQLFPSSFCSTALHKHVSADLFSHLFRKTPSSSFPQHFSFPSPPHSMLAAISASLNIWSCLLCFKWVWISQNKLMAFQFITGDCIFFLFHYSSKCMFWVDFTFCISKHDIYVFICHLGDFWLMDILVITWLVLHCWELSLRILVF